MEKKPAISKPTPKEVVFVEDFISPKSCSKDSLVGWSPTGSYRDQSQPLQAAQELVMDYDRWKRALVAAATGASANSTGGKLDPSSSSSDDGFDADGLIDSLSVDALRVHLKALVTPVRKLVSAVTQQQLPPVIPRTDGVASENTSSSARPTATSSGGNSLTTHPGRPIPLGGFAAPPTPTPTNLNAARATIEGSFVTIFNHFANKHHDRVASSSTSLALGGQSNVVRASAPGAGGHRQTGQNVTASKTTSWEPGSMTAAMFELSLTAAGRHTEPKNAFQRTATASVGVRPSGEEEEEEDEPWELNQYLVLHLLGQGSQGSVYLGFDNEKNEFRAVKEIKRPLATSAAMQQIRSEVDIMKRLRHRNLITLYELIDDPQHQYMYLVMRYAEKGILVKYTSDDQTTNETVELSKVSYYAKQLTAALAYLHCHEIYHRDIKPENVLCGKDDEVYLADFGVAQMLERVNLEGSGSMNADSVMQSGSSLLMPPRSEPQQEQPSLRVDTSSSFASTRGTPAYFAPELAAGEIAECDLDLAAVDVWALGVTIYQLLCGKLPFSRTELTNHANTPNREKQILKLSLEGEGGKENPSPRDGDSLSEVPSASYAPSGVFHHSVNYLDNLLQDDICPIPAHVPKEWEKILRGMLNKNPKQRMTVPEVRARLKAMDVKKKKKQPVSLIRRTQPKQQPGDTTPPTGQGTNGDETSVVTFSHLPSPPTTMIPTENPRLSSTRSSSVASRESSEFLGTTSDSDTHSSEGGEPEPPKRLGAAIITTPAEEEERPASSTEKLRSVIATNRKD